MRLPKPVLNHYSRKRISSLTLVLLAMITGLACGQSQTASSSADYRALVTPDELGGSLAAPAPSGGQYGDPGHRPGYAVGRDWRSHLAVEAGGGFTAPIDHTSDVLTYGWNLRGGLGWNFNKRLALLGEWEFDRNKITAAVLNQVNQQAQIPGLGGNVHNWSLTLDPVFNYKTGGRWGGYVTGGGGFYRQLTSFTQPVQAIGTYCDYFYCYPYYYNTTALVSHSSSNQGGLNIGTGFTFGRWEHAKFFAEARYEWIDTPGRSTELVPVTFGLRW